MFAALNIASLWVAFQKMGVLINQNVREALKLHELAKKANKKRAKL